MRRPMQRKYAAKTAARVARWVGKKNVSLLDYTISNDRQPQR